jgi:hypothetical protein
LVALNAVWSVEKKATPFVHETIFRTVEVLVEGTVALMVLMLGVELGLILAVLMVWNLVVSMGYTKVDSMVG